MISKTTPLLYDYLIVGAGMTGSVLAERLASLGQRVLVVESRDHIGGNCYDFYDEYGILVHKYGPHYFRTDSDEVFGYLSQFTEWHYHEYTVRAKIGNRLYTFPINLNTLREYFGRDFTEQEAKIFFEEIRDKSISIPKNAEEQVLSKIGKELYEAFFKGYTEKQWGMPATQLAPSVTARIPLRLNTDGRYVLGKIQAVPQDGYTKMFEKMLMSNNITLQLSTKFKKDMLQIAKKVIWTGKIDEFFEYEFGPLPYRSLQFEFSHHAVEYLQPCEQINFPEKAIPWTRTIEIKHVTGQKIQGTTIVTEYPMSEGDPYYPVPTPANHTLYTKYLNLANQNNDVIFLGRLAKYAYINMDEVVMMALATFSDIQKEFFNT